MCSVKCALSRRTGADTLVVYSLGRCPLSGRSWLQTRDVYSRDCFDPRDVVWKTSDALRIRSDRRDNSIQIILIIIKKTIDLLVLYVSLILVRVDDILMRGFLRMTEEFWGSWLCVVLTYPLRYVRTRFRRRADETDETDAVASINFQNWRSHLWRLFVLRSNMIHHMSRIQWVTRKITTSLSGVTPVSKKWRSCARRSSFIRVSHILDHTGVPSRSTSGTLKRDVFWKVFHWGTECQRNRSVTDNSSVWFPTCVEIDVIRRDISHCPSFLTHESKIFDQIKNDERRRRRETRRSYLHWIIDIIILILFKRFFSEKNSD